MGRSTNLRFKTLSQESYPIQDHLDFGPIYELNVANTAFMSDPARAHELAMEYNVNRTGPLTSPLVDFIGWEKLPEPYRSALSQSARDELAGFSADWPELEYEINQAFTPPTSSSGNGYGNILTILVAPKSRGTVTLASSSTTDLPIVDPGFLTEKTDQELAVQAFKRARSIASQSSILPIIIGEEVSPGPAVRTDEQILESIQQTAYQNWHASCTCKPYRSGIIL